MYLVSQKIVPDFEAANHLMSEILVFFAFLELYNSFGLPFLCFHGLMNIIYAGTKLFSEVVFSQSWNSKEFLS